ncbi:protein REGULATOR OF FATTY ACID COMPOSITION 3, chloroplastic-like isoform X1 [Alnus glutinosa]|uniref:protein REGULATOR OF FATTY ACID COMPOSITION 3, chloroplastic-like isoform X1 n=1 Tax=Alnus glutinosa TaxID=3517 RepID=UPI002D787C5F|nr:protein REGULATOR OF FATTY ACID COMPOSITION 3, chloroplastic-like isoform X1 [Alnus glutinosa]
MEALLNTSFAANLTPKAPKFVDSNCCSFLKNQNPCIKFANGYSPFTFSGPFTSQKLPIGLRGSVIVGAKKNHKSKKEDTHSFVPKQDESTGFFPEAVLLKEKKVQDGKLLPEFADAEEQGLYETLMLELESDTVLEQMRHYEVVYLIHEKHEEEVGSVNEKVQDFLREKKGKIWRLNDWGIRRLAYKIKKAKNAHYILMNFELEAKWINDFKSMLDKDERVIRHLVMKTDEAITEDCPPPPEFHTLRGDMDDSDEEDDIGDDDDYDNEDDGEDWDGEGEMDGYDDETEDGIIVIKDDAGDREHTNDISAIIRNKGRKNLKAEKVGR